MCRVREVLIRTTVVVGRYMVRNRIGHKPGEGLAIANCGHLDRL